MPREAITARYQRALLAALDLDEHSPLVDIGCGTGVLSIETGRVASAGRVLGVDLSSRMLTRARAKAAAEGLGHVRFEYADAQTFAHPRPSVSASAASAPFL